VKGNKGVGISKQNLKSPRRIVSINRYMADNNNLEELLDEYPFLTVAVYGKIEYLGIIQNQDGNLISMYVYEDIRSPELRKEFLEFGAEWWWETNRMIPINIILGRRFAPFRPVLRTFNLKDFEIKYGPTVCLKNIMQKRVKRKNVQLIRKID
jgi:hypothetical protein